jgi:hypothetical protein
MDASYCAAIVGGRNANGVNGFGRGKVLLLDMTSTIYVVGKEYDHKNGTLAAGKPMGTVWEGSTRSITFVRYVHRNVMELMIGP